MKQDVVYIMGVGHSGSTILQMLLSGHKDLIGIGEISLLIKNILASKSDYSEWPLCSCGQTVENCSFWGEYVKLNDKSLSDVEMYQRVIDHFLVKHPQKILIDSSKNLDTFKKFYTGELSKKVNVKVIFLIRDFRSWIISREKNNKRKSRKNYGLIFNAYKWYYRNNRKFNYLRNNKLQHVVVSYEDLVFQKEKTLDRITEFLNLEKCDWKTSDPEMHDVFGNRMKNDLEKQKQFSYNNQWMKSNKVAFLAPLLLFPYLLNKKIYRK